MRTVLVKLRYIATLVQLECIQKIFFFENKNKNKTFCFILEHTQLTVL